MGDNPIILYLGDAFIDPGAEATDNEDGDITDKIEVCYAKINPSVAGSHHVYYTVGDRAGNVAIAIRDVKVKESIDTIPPVITLKIYLQLVSEAGEASINGGPELPITPNFTTQVDPINKEVGTTIYPTTNMVRVSFTWEKVP